MSPNRARCNCKASNGKLMTKAISSFRSLVSPKGYSPVQQQTGCDFCQPLTSAAEDFAPAPAPFYKSYANLYEDLQDENFDAKNRQRMNTVRREICRYIWGDCPGKVLEDWEEVIVDRVYSELKLDNSPVIAFFERNGPCNMARLPAGLKKLLDSAIGDHAGYR
ncbi:hypothetical protein F5Y07DRAFT_306794 [Xylaria sp. FL0933]|nr:hypothetical protein F5Y07DRAFT_306794 [Xylaria sp. FL0933]